MHLHVYELNRQPDNNFNLSLQTRLSTDADGVNVCLGLQAEARVELEHIIQALEQKIANVTLFR